MFVRIAARATSNYHDYRLWYFAFCALIVSKLVFNQFRIEFNPSWSTLIKNPGTKVSYSPIGLAHIILISRDNFNAFPLISTLSSFMLDKGTL